MSALANKLLQKPFKAADADVEALLLVGLYQLLYTRIPAHAAIGETVGCADKLKKPWAKALLNAVLRNAQRESEALLAELPDASWVEPHVNHRVDARIVEDLTAMLTAAEAAGTHPIICSSFRTYDYQENLFENRIERAEREEHLEGTEAEEAAAFWVAPPGASEHQTGLAVDIVDADYLELDEGQESTATQQWLMAHCTEYGFILRYPTDKSATTGIGYEPWHYRYVGKEAASDIAESGLCLEEWLVETYHVQA